MTSRLLLLLAAVLAALILTAGRAAAGTYVVQTCDAGWRAGEWGQGASVEDRCAGGPGLVATLGGGNVAVPLGTGVSWRFAAPEGTWISAFRLSYSGYARPYDWTDTGTQGVIGVEDEERGAVATHEGAGDVGPRTAAAAGRHDRWVEAYGRCDGPEGHPPCPAHELHARVVVERSAIELTDPAPPASGAPSGSAATDAAWDGRERLAVGLSDAGGGLWRWSLAVDGAEALSGPVSDSATCPADRAFTVPRPCPAEADLLLDVDTTTLPAGTHDVTVRVADAAGNQRTVFSARRTIAGAAAPLPHVDDVPVAATAPVAVAPAARLTARWARTTARTLTVGFAGRPALRGRLTRPDGAPVRGAAIALAMRGADAGGTRTRPDGTFTLVLPGRRPSATIALRHRPSGAHASLRLRVRAGLTLRARRRGGRNVLLAGALLGRPLPRGGKVVELQARVRGGRWLTFRTVRTDARGRYRLRYRFRTAHPERYALRARARSSAGYPYATGVSAAVRVKLR